MEERLHFQVRAEQRNRHLHKESEVSGEAARRRGLFFVGSKLVSRRPEQISSRNRIGACCAMGLAGRYRIEISSEGIVAVVDSDDRLDVARSLYWHTVMNHPNRLVMLCDRASVIARSDQPETMPN